MPKELHVDIPLENYISRATQGGMRIATARDTIPALRLGPQLTLADWLKLEASKFLIDVAPGLYATPVQARILYGRWLVDCPVCNGCNDVVPDEPVYLCTSCGWPGQLAPVEFPAEKKEIERLLLKRPRASNRNWSIGEPAEKLIAENLLAEGEV
jgi:hypothetical protein